MKSDPGTVVYLTAGAAGMFCGSCMNDNTLARALVRRGCDVLLVPTYTPIRTDDENVSLDRVFFGGATVYLEQIMPGFRWLAPILGPLLDQPWLLNAMTRRASSIAPEAIGTLTVSMLRGVEGRQRREVEQICRWLKTSARPRLIVFSNMLIAGCAPQLKAQLKVPLLVTLQGDDIFLESLPAKHRQQAIREMQRIAANIDGFLVHSQYYADFMADYLGIPRDRIHQIPLGVDVADFQAAERNRSRAIRQASDPATIGYLARLTPEKGLHLLVDAFLHLRERDPRELRLRIAGYLGKDHQAYVNSQFDKLRAAGRMNDVEYVGTVDRQDKIRFLQSLDLFSVPTTYRDPKGLYVLEALAAGVPVVQPAHGAFPELLAKLEGGVLVPPNDPLALAETISRLLDEGEHLPERGQKGQAHVLREFHADAVAEATWSCWQRFLPLGNPQ